MPAPRPRVCSHVPALNSLEAVAHTGERVAPQGHLMVPKEGLEPSSPKRAGDFESPAFWVTIRVRVSGREQPGAVFMPFHFREAAANLLTIDELDPDGKIPEFKFCAVRIEKA